MSTRLHVNVNDETAARAGDAVYLTAPDGSRTLVVLP